MKRMAQTLTTSPRKMAGAAMRPKPMPHDFMAVISLELERRPKVSSEASNIDMGKVHMMIAGRP